MECDASDLGFGAAAYQYKSLPANTNVDEGQLRLNDTSPKRVVEWLSKAWTTDQPKLPVFHRESLARLIVLEKFRNLIEANIDSGVTVYTDHLPALFKGSLSNKGQLSAWRINEVQDLNSLVDTIYKKGPKMLISDALSRICQPENDLYNRNLPRFLAVLLDRLPEAVRNVKHIRVHANKDTAVAGRIVQKWRVPKNQISLDSPTSSGDTDFAIGFPQDKATHDIANLLTRGIAFAMLLPVSLLHRVSQDPKTELTMPLIQSKLDICAKIVMSAYNLVWIVHYPTAPDVVGTQVLQSATQPTTLSTVLFALPDSVPLSRTPVKMNDGSSSTILGHHLAKHEVGCSHIEPVNIMDCCLADTICLPSIRQQATIEAEQYALSGIATTVVNSNTFRSVMAMTRSQNLSDKSEDLSHAPPPFTSKVAPKWPEHRLPGEFGTACAAF